MNEPEDFAAFTRIADALIGAATKDQLADVARLLALNVGWYQARYGDVPQEALLGMVRTTAFNEDARRLVLSGMQNLVAALAEVTGLTDTARRRPAPLAALCFSSSARPPWRKRCQGELTARGTCLSRARLRYPGRPPPGANRILNATHLGVDASPGREANGDRNRPIPDMGPFGPPYATRIKDSRLRPRYCVRAPERPHFHGSRGALFTLRR